MVGHLSAARVGPIVVIVSVGLAAAGCDRLPWSTEEPEEATAASVGAAASVPARPAVLPTETIARVNGVAISTADVELRIEELKTLTASVGQPWEALTREDLEAIADELVNTELMAQDAAARGVDRSLPVQRRWEYIRRGFYAQEWLRWHQERQTVSEEETRAYYDDNQLGFREPERRRVREIAVETESQAKQALAQLHGGAATFEQLARQVSQGPTAAEGGMLAGWVMRANDKAFLFGSDAQAEAAEVTSLDPLLEAAAFAIDQVNGISNYVRGADGRYHIYQLVERQAERQQAFQDVHDDIRNFLLVQRLDEAVQQLRGAATIERYPERLEGLTD